MKHGQLGAEFVVGRADKGSERIIGNRRPGVLGSFFRGVAVTSLDSDLLRCSIELEHRLTGEPLSTLLAVGAHVNIDKVTDGERDLGDGLATEYFR